MTRILFFLFISSNFFAQNFLAFSPIAPIKKSELSGSVTLITPPIKGISLSLQNAHTSQVISVNLSKNGNYALTSSSDNTIKLWETGFKKILHTFTAEGVKITQAFLSQCVLTLNFIFVLKLNIFRKK